MTILDQIIVRKREEVQAAKISASPSELMRMDGFGLPCLSLKESVLHPERNGIIAEFKRASPSQGIINNHSPLADVLKGYEEGGASAVSVLTDQDFFGGTLADLVEARRTVNIPILRKDFIIDPYQITEAKAYGADVILLIAAALTNSEVKAYSEYAKSLGLYVLLEVHNAEELDGNLLESIDAIGVNNRNLHTFKVDIAHSIALVKQIPDTFLKISESGLSEVSTVIALREAGFQGFLMGEHFMKAENPGQELSQFASKLKNS